MADKGPEPRKEQPETPAQLRERAVHLRWVIQHMSDANVVRVLRAYADELEAWAAAIDEKNQSC